MYALSIVQEFFPEVTSVKDAKHAREIEVTKHDNDTSKKRNHKECAMALACKRATHADGVIISVKTAYVIEGRTATRYHLPERVSREVISFDRNGGFAPGIYKMLAPANGHHLGYPGGHSSHTGKQRKSKPHIIKRNMTTGIRTVLGSKLT